MSEPTPSRWLRGEEIDGDGFVRDVLGLRLVAVLSTIERDGSVHAVPMWYAPQRGAIVLATGSGSRKVRNLERDDRATLVVHDSRPGAEVRGVSVRGRVEIVREVEARPLVEAVHRRYVELRRPGLEPVARLLAGDDVALRLQPESALVWDQRGTEAALALRAHGGALPLEPTSPRSSP